MYVGRHAELTELAVVLAFLKQPDMEGSDHCLRLIRPSRAVLFGVIMCKLFFQIAQNLDHHHCCLNMLSLTQCLSVAVLTWIDAESLAAEGPSHFAPVMSTFFFLGSAVSELCTHSMPCRLLLAELGIQEITQCQLLRFACGRISRLP